MNLWYFRNTFQHDYSERFDFYKTACCSHAMPWLNWGLEQQLCEILDVVILNDFLNKMDFFLLESD